MCADWAREGKRVHPAHTLTGLCNRPIRKYLTKHKKKIKTIVSYKQRRKKVPKKQQIHRIQNYRGNNSTVCSIKDYASNYVDGKRVHKMNGLECCSRKRIFISYMWTAFFFHSASLCVAMLAMVMLYFSLHSFFSLLCWLTFSRAHQKQYSISKNLTSIDDV